MTHLPTSELLMMRVELPLTPRVLEKRSTVQLFEKGKTFSPLPMGKARLSSRITVGATVNRPSDGRGGTEQHNLLL